MAVQTPNRVLKRLAVFKRDKGGAVAMIFALAAVPLLGLTGAAIDFSSARGVKNRLQAGADAAVLEAVRLALKNDEDNNTFADYKRSDTSFGPIASGKGMFTGAAASVTNALSPSINIEVEKKGNEYFARATYSAEYKMMLPVQSIVSNLSVEGTSSSAISVSGSGYMDVYAMLDSSPSMGLGASPADIAILQAKTGCAFTCHADSPTYGATLRIDVLRSAVGDMIQTASDSVGAGDTPRIRIGLYNFEGKTKEMAAITDNYGSLKGHINKLKIHQDGTGSTNIGGSMEWLTPQVSASGNGLTPDKPKKFVFLVTDGMENKAHTWRPTNYLGPYSYYGSVGSLDPAKCKALKDKGVTVAVLYTTYYNVGSGVEWAYQSALPGVEPHLRECASPDFFFQASDASQLKKEFGKMFKKAVLATKPRLTN